MKIIDTTGQPCPAPIIATKKALREATEGEEFKVLTDNKETLSNLSRFLKENNTRFLIEDAGGLWTITITAMTPNPVLTQVEDYYTPDIPHFSTGDFIIVFSSDKMGEGDEELGHLLTINFIKAIKDLDVLPAKIVFYNRGIMLGSEDSPAFEHLREIEKMGVGLLICVTCAKHYKLEEKIRIGTLSNMFEIAQVMASAGNIIKP